MILLPTPLSHAPLPTILFDDSCPLCRRLAQWSERRLEGRIHFVSWQYFCSLPQANLEANSFCKGNYPEQLVFIDGNTIKTGAQAWDHLLQHHPSLRELRWLAQKLGLEAQVASHLGQTAGWLRSAWCRTCPKPPLR